MKKDVMKKGVSPVIATVLLIAMVVVIGLIIFLWFRGFVGERVTKFEQNIDLTCGEVKFTAEYDSSSERLSVVNTGNVPIYKMKAQVFNAGGHSTYDIDSNQEGLDWPASGLGSIGAFSAVVDDLVGSTFDKIVLIPVLRGSSDKGDRTYVCDENQGFEIV